MITERIRRHEVSLPNLYYFKLVKIHSRAREIAHTTSKARSPSRHDEYCLISRNECVTNELQRTSEGRLAGPRFVDIQEILLPWQRDVTTSPLYAYGRLRSSWNRKQEWIRKQ